MCSSDLVRHILGLHRKLFSRIEELNANNVRVNWIGRPFDEPGSRTPGNVQKSIRQAIEDTKHNTGMVLTVAFDYGSRAEIARAAKHARRASIASASGTVAGAITPHQLEAHLYDPNLPPVDVLVRTSGETRISNFMLWQSAGARVYFTDCSWPDFGAAEIDEAIALARPRSA